MRVYTLRVELRVGQHPPHSITADLLIDGCSLVAQVGRVAGRAFGLVAPLGNWVSAAQAREYADRLIGAAPPVLPSGRCELLVCAVCGDLGCGYVSCRVERAGECVVWSELGWEVAFDPTSFVHFPMGGFRFRAADLASAFHSAGVGPT